MSATTKIVVPLVIEVDVEKWASLNGLEAPTHQAFDAKVQEDIRSYVLAGVQGLSMLDETEATVRIKTNRG
jgi:hypothetical protein